MFLDFAVYGRYGALDMIKTLSQGVGTFSTPAKPNSENFFLTFLSPQPPPDRAGPRLGTQFLQELD